MQGDAGPVDETRARLVERLRVRREELVAEIFAWVRLGAPPGPRDEDKECMEGLHASVAAAVENVLEGIERGEDWAAPISEVASEQARRAARMGASLSSVLRRYAVGHTLFEQFVMDEADRAGEIGIPPAEHESLQVATRGSLRTQAAVLDRLLERIAAEYGNELQRMGRSPEQRRAEGVGRLLAGGAVESHAAAAVRLDYELEDRWHLGVIATGPGAEQAVRGLAVSADRRLLSVAQHEQSVWAWLGGRGPFAAGELERAIACTGMGKSHSSEGPSPPEGIAVSPTTGVIVALGEPGWGIEGWRLTHQQAQAALAVAQRRADSGGVTRYAGVALLASALKDELLGRTLIDVYVTPLDASRYSGAVLRQTLRAYLTAGRSVSSAAAALRVARSTVETRLRAVEQTLGRLLPACLAELEIALALEELGGPTGVTCR